MTLSEFNHELVYLDAIVVKVRTDGHISSRPVHIVLGWLLTYIAASPSVSSEIVADGRSASLLSPKDLDRLSLTWDSLQ